MILPDFVCSRYGAPHIVSRIKRKTDWGDNVTIGKQLGLAVALVIAAATGWALFIPSAGPILERAGLAGPLERIGVSLATGDEDDNGGGPPRGGMGPVTVIAASVEQGLVNNRATAIGSGRALRSVAITPDEPGRLAELSVRSGDTVEAGDIVARLDDAAQRIARDRAEIALADARETAARFERLSESGATTSVDIRQSELELRQAELELRQAEYELSRRAIVAPIAGSVGLLKAEIGERVSDSTEITRIDDREQLLVEFRVPERFVGLIDTGQTVRAYPLSRPATEYSGRVSALDNRVDPTSRTLQVEAEIENPDDTLRAGMAFSVELEFDGDSHPGVPPLAIQWSSDGAYVWAVRDGAVERVDVAIVQRRSDVVLVEAALEAGEQIVTEGVQMLRPGAEVRVEGAAPEQVEADDVASES